MLKGKMIIEMTDVHTGETEKVIEHNMITNALSEIFKLLGLSKSPSILLNSFAPYYQKLSTPTIPMPRPVINTAVILSACISLRLRQATKVQTVHS